MTVYLIRDAETRGGRGAVKIGYTSRDVMWRLRLLQVGAASALELVAEIPEGTRAVERELQDQFSQYWIRGEWYEDHDDIRLEFKRRVSGRQDPTADLPALVMAREAADRIVVQVDGEIDEWTRKVGRRTQEVEARALHDRERTLALDLQLRDPLKRLRDQEIAAHGRVSESTAARIERFEVDHARAGVAVLTGRWDFPAA